jgi:hypothetical protein
MATTEKHGEIEGEREREIRSIPGRAILVAKKKRAEE